MGTSICWAAAEADTQFTIFDSSALKKQLLIFGVTIFVALTVVALSLLIGFPAAYILARRNLRWKSLLLLLYFLPLLIPQMTYGIPLATTMLRYGIGGTVAGVILAVMVPMVPLAIFIPMPFFEQISVNLEWGAAMMGANRLQIFRLILLPLCRSPCRVSS
jgi:putative spermidine/putrescine transport system permease protein